MSVGALMSIGLANIPWASSQSPAEETAMIEAVLAEYDLPENTTFIAQLGFADRLENLRSANAAYVAVDRERHTNTISKSGLPYRNSAAKKTAADLNTVIRALFFFYDDTTDQAYLDGFDKIRNISAQLAATARLRKTDAENAAKKNPTPTPAPSSTPSSAPNPGVSSTPN